jgi:Protein of unknown function (DUF2868)
VSAVAAPAAFVFDEASAREVLLLQAVETAPAGPLWTAEDADWATRQALTSAGADAPPARFLADRARHALQRLLPRDAAATGWLASRGWRPTWLLWAALAAGAAGIAADSLGGSNHINLLAPPVWAVLAWNAAVYALLLVQAARALRGVAPAGALRQRLVGWLAGARVVSKRLPGAAAVAQASAGWARLSAPLWAPRAGAVLHVAAAALALGLVAGLYLRGLAFDIRAGWESTFLGTAIVHALLAGGLAPASALTGIAVPGVDTIDALRLVPGVPASASAAPWIHLYAATLALAVIVPRAVLAAWALWKAGRAATRLTLPLDAYFQRLLRRQRGDAALVQVLPHAAAVNAQAALGLRALLAPAFGPTLQLRLAEPSAFGDEERAAAIATEPGTSLRVALFDLGATPEADSQGRFVRALQQAAPGLPLLMVVDEAGFARRFGALADRMAERRRAWQRLADDAGCALLCVDLEAPDPAPAAAWLDAALAQATSATAAG